MPCTLTIVKEGVPIHESSFNGSMLLVSGNASARQFAGSWTGEYHVKPKFDKEDTYSVTLKVVEKAPSKLQATFYFHETPVSENVEGHNQTAGCFAMTGSVNPKTNKMTLNSSGWLGGKKFIRADSLTASVVGNALTGKGVQSKYDKSPPTLI